MHESGNYIVCMHVSMDVCMSACMLHIPYDKFFYCFCEFTPINCIIIRICTNRSLKPNL